METLRGDAPRLLHGSDTLGQCHRSLLHFGAILVFSWLALPAAAQVGQPLVDVSTVAAGGDHSCALTTGGGVKCWGSNVVGQIGDGSTEDRFSPVDVLGLASGVIAISAGDSHTCALTSAGGVKCWGSNVFGQLGDGSTTQRLTSVDVLGLSSGVSAISAGGQHSCAVTTAGGVKCWGRNNFGQLGDDSTTQRLSPVDVSGLASGGGVISAGLQHSCALTTGGGVKCWGRNSSGQLGDGSTSNRLTPVEVTGLTSGVSAISADMHYSCALTTSGAVKCWGSNSQGQLGDGSTTQRLTPVAVSGLTGGTSAISSGAFHSCALSTAGSVKCWGGMTPGRLATVAAANLGLRRSAFPA